MTADLKSLNELGFERLPAGVIILPLQAILQTRLLASTECKPDGQFPFLMVFMHFDLPMTLLHSNI
jgi:hypothetical protein